MTQEEQKISLLDVRGFYVLMLCTVQAIEDLKRHRADRKANNLMYTLVDSDGKDARVKSADIKVGMILKISEGEEIPSDVLLLKSSR